MAGGGTADRAGDAAPEPTRPPEDRSTSWLAQLRREHEDGGLLEPEVDADPLRQLERWLDDALASGLAQPNAIVLATAAPDGTPAARTVLLKGLDERGLVFYTNDASAKARDLAANPRAEVVFPWHPLGRQVRVAGSVTRVDREESAAYFATRPRDSQLGAWASRQSEVVPDRAALDRALAEVADRWPEGAPVPLPPFWGGYRLRPQTYEFWQGRRGRLHDRLRYRRGPDGAWVLERLAP